MAESPGLRRLRLFMAGGMGLMTVLHVVAHRSFEAMVPTWVPGSPVAWNAAATVAEGTTAALLAREETAGAGGYLAAATFVAVYPANVQAALDGGYPIEGPMGSATAAWLRLPLQFLFIGAALRVARGAGEHPEG